MPYKHLAELPDGVKNNLPAHAQKIYINAFNSAYDSYKNERSNHRDVDNRETVSHRVAWSAVKKKYHKTEQGWKHKE